MIGVIANEKERKAVKEFFELFKTPWEYYSPDHNYDVIISTGKGIEKTGAGLEVIYCSDRTLLDFGKEFGIKRKFTEGMVEYESLDIPIYRGLITFEREGKAILKLKGCSESAGLKIEISGKRIALLGYNLFEEVDFLLSSGQPKRNALIPTLDIHISILRDLIRETGNIVVEIPPVPAGYKFIACLTHDIDFAGVRKHRFDETFFGFLYRASIGSLLRFLKGNLSFSKMIGNWKTILNLPFVYLGFMKDFWVEFDRFLELEKGLGGTYFFIPFRNRRGCLGIGKASRKRACKYSIEEIRGEIEKLMGQGCEIGLHGIDAWIDEKKGRDEYERIKEMTGQKEIGVRMHWLFFDAESPRVMEKVGFSYDSTVGYNEAIGYRAGTSQVYQHPGVQNLVEIPMHVQDTALFYPERMNLSPRKALQKIERLIQNAEKYGGVLTINWHNRSLGPERFWDDSYAELLSLLKEKKVWFGTAWQVVKWFRRRRALSVEEIQGLKFSAQMDLDGTLIQSGGESPNRALLSQGSEQKGKSWNFESYGLARARE